MRAVRLAGHRVAHAQLRHLNPFPVNLGAIVKAYGAVLVPEVNLGQLRKIVRSDFLVDAQGLNKVNGLPFRRTDVELAIISQLGAVRDHAGGGQAGRGGRAKGGNGHSKEHK